MKNPYEDLPDKAFWKLAVANLSMFDISEIWDPKFDIEKNQNIVTFGSCFAQHIGISLKQRGFKWLSTELPPHGLSEENARYFNYNIFSARTGNIYTTTLLLQWTEWALGKKDIPHEVWKNNDRYYDPFRPRIEPNKHKFENQKLNQVISALNESMRLMREVNSKLKFILTVSPVPLTATNSNQHILVATMASKSTLRSVTCQLLSEEYIDYFPSYEIINSPCFRGVFFEPNQRNVSTFGVNFVMGNFFKCLDGKFGKSESKKQMQQAHSKITDIVCEEELLEAFRK